MIGYIECFICKKQFKVDINKNVYDNLKDLKMFYVRIFKPGGDCDCELYLCEDCYFKLRY